MSETTIVAVTGAVLKNGTYGDLPLTAHLAFYPEDPLAVTMVLKLDVELGCGHVAEAENSWTFSREIIDAALSHIDGRTIGEGDVTARHLAFVGVLVLQLTAADNVKHDLYLDAGPVYDFMEESQRLIPVGKEIVNVDEAIEKLLDGSWNR